MGQRKARVREVRLQRWLVGRMIDVHTRSEGLSNSPEGLFGPKYCEGELRSELTPHRRRRLRWRMRESVDAGAYCVRFDTSGRVP